MGKAVTLDLTWLIGYRIKRTPIKTIIAETFYNKFGQCYVHAARNETDYDSIIVNLFDIKVLTVNTQGYHFICTIYTSTGLIYKLYIVFEFSTITTISDTVDFGLGGTCYRFYPKRKEGYETFKIERPKEKFNIENLWKR